MNLEKQDVIWVAISIAIFLVLGVLLLFVYFVCININITTPEFLLSVLLVISVIALLVFLTFTSVIFKYLGLSDRTQSLGLPEGSVRAVIALSLILIFMISSLLLYERVDLHGNPSVENYIGITQMQLDDIPKQEIAYIVRVKEENNETLFNAGRILEKSKTSEDIAKQIVTTMSTLVVAVAGFYFGSKAVAGVNSGITTVPVIRSINPTEGRRDKEIEFRIYGKNFELVKEVKLIRDSIEIPCTDITSNSTMIACTLKIPNDPEGYPAGKWTVVVINSDIGDDRLEGAFTVSEN